MGEVPLRETPTSRLIIPRHDLLIRHLHALRQEVVSTRRAAGESRGEADETQNVEQTKDEISNHFPSSLQLEIE
jgi:hypothetical protein